MSDIAVPPPGYDLLDTLPIDTPERMRAIADPVRTLIADLVLERAMSVTELAARVGRARGTVAHHVDVLCDTGLLQVVGTRKVRAIEERFYGRTARTYMFPAHDGDDLPFVEEARDQWDRARHDAEEIGGFTLRHARIPTERAKEFWVRIEHLAVEFTQSSREGDVEYAFYAGVFPTNRPVAPRPPRPKRKGDRRAR
jgi:DNA-binding transcriptional ArsR family regulator